MKQMIKKQLAVLFSLLLLLAAVASPVAAKQEGLHYVALGDSLAAGQTPDRKIGTSYTDMIAQKLKGDGVLGSFTKEFAVPGYTTAEVLRDMQKPEQQQAIMKADIITISAGANDLLKLVKVNDQTGKTDFDPVAVAAAMQKLQQNIGAILTQINTINPEAHVYVMGYYFPYPHMQDDSKPDLIKVSKYINQTLESLSKAAGAQFVPVYDKFGEDAKELLPNPKDIHPNEAGYQKMAAAFFEHYSDGGMIPVDFKDVPKTHWAHQEISALVAMKILSGRTGDYFEPNSMITKAETATALANTIYAKQDIPPDPGFKDIPKDHPAYPAIAKMTEAGIFVKAEKFNPDAPLTRAQLAKIISLSFGLPTRDVIRFNDVPEQFWAKEYIEKIASNKIMNGYQTNFKPNNKTTRAQFAVTLVRAVQQMKQPATTK